MSGLSGLPFWIDMGGVALVFLSPFVLFGAVYAVVSLVAGINACRYLAADRAGREAAFRMRGLGVLS